ncbi:MAG: hypothetical protein LBH29_04035 [Elusimicrobiota bacterium]|jgi:hypothetical protein|nr:hypothetical protein [Elusimicrobiota bacterium]
MNLDLTEIDKDTARRLADLFGTLSTHKQIEAEFKAAQGSALEVYGWNNGLKFFYKTGSLKLSQCIQELIAERIKGYEADINELLTGADK